MKTIERQIIEKMDELINKLYLHLSADFEDDECGKLEGELITLRSELAELEVKTAEANFMQVRDLTDEEWLKLPKEEILQLYKNCYEMLQNHIKLSGEKISDIQTYTTTESSQFQEQPITDEMILRKADDYGTYWQELWKELRMTKKQQSEVIIAFARGYNCALFFQQKAQPGDDRDTEHAITGN